jgi:multisubunit Na+/H+ antiporter MnhB subunit
VKLVLTARDGELAEVHADDGGNMRAVVGWSAAGLAGAALVTSGVLGLRAMSLADDYNDPSSSKFQDADTRSSGVGLRTGADVALGVAVLSGAAALILLLTDLGAPAAKKATARNAPLLRW